MLSYLKESIFGMLVILWFIVMPVAAFALDVEFVGPYSSYGDDTNNDGKYEFLIFKAGIKVNKGGYYYFYGLLQDSEGNINEFSRRVYYDTGFGYVYMQFDGTKIFLNKVNGPYAIKRIEVSRDSIPPELIQGKDDVHLTDDYNYTQFQAPPNMNASKYCILSPCNIPKSLIGSRDNIGNNENPKNSSNNEPNQPNTIDGCNDGTAGTYFDSGSIDSITIRSLEGSYFEVGKPINISLVLNCHGVWDRLSIFYTTDPINPSWVLKKTAQCPGSGIKKLSFSFDLAQNPGNHTIRTVLQPKSLLESCGTSPYADNDDVMIKVDKCVDNDGDGYGNPASHICRYAEEDCDDNNPAVNPRAQEICDDNIDNDCDGLIDMDDDNCINNNITISFAKGWNLASLPNIENTSIEFLLGLFKNKCERVLVLRNKRWLIFDLEHHYNNLYEINGTNGFWIKLKEDLNISFEKKQEQKATIMSLTKGWNMIGYPSTETKKLDEVFSGVSDDIELVYLYKNNNFNSYSPEKNGVTNLYVKPGTGIFVKLKNNAEWFFNGTYSHLNSSSNLVEFNLTLAKGWNLISAPLSLKDCGVFCGNTLYYLDNGKWRELDGAVDYTKGYWLNPNISKKITLRGNPINGMNVRIIKGWNLISYPLLNRTTLSYFFGNTLADIEAIFIYNSHNKSWSSFSKLKSGSNTILEPGFGIFVKSNNNADWYFDGNKLNKV